MNLNMNKLDTNVAIPVDSPIATEDQDKFSLIESMFTNDGYVTVKDDESNEVVYGHMTFNDLLTSGDLLRFVPKIVTTMLRGSINPRMVIANTLFKNVNVNQQIQVKVGQFGPLQAEEQPEGKNWKESHVAFDGGEMIQPVQYKKIGVQYSFTNETKKVGGFDVVRLVVSEAAKALVRKKEKLCMDTMEVGGEPLFDNINPTDSYFGNTTGRNVTGAFNGTFTLNDMITMYSYENMRGFNPDTVLMNPMGWLVFATSPDTREIVTSGNVVTSSPQPNGSAEGYSNTFGQWGLNTESGRGSATPSSVLGKIGVDPFVQGLNPYNASFKVDSSYFPGGMRVIVSPFVKYNTAGGAVAANSGKPSTDVIMADSNATGVIVTAESPAMREYDDFFTESTIMRLGEVYGTEVLYQGQAIGVAKGVIVDRNYVFENRNNVTIGSAEPGNVSLASS